MEDFRIKRFKRCGRKNTDWKRGQVALAESRVVGDTTAADNALHKVILKDNPAPSITKQISIEKQECRAWTAR